MQPKVNYEPKISLRDLIFHVLYRWRSIVIAALLMAVVLTGYQYLRTRGEKNNAAWKQQKEAYQQELDLFNREKKNLNEAIRSSTEQIEALRDYQAHSLLCSVDPEAEWYAIRQYSVRINAEDTPNDRSDPADDVLACYIAAIRNADSERLKQLTGTEDEQYARELITAGPGIPVSFSGIVEQYSQEVLIPRRSLEDHILTVEIRGGEEGMVRELMLYLTELIEGEGAVSAQQIAGHELVLLNADVQLRPDPELKAGQDGLEVKIRTLLSDIQSSQKGLTALTAPSKPSRANLTKNAVLGAVLGAMVLAGIYAFSYVLGGRLHLSDELRRKYGLPVYGEFNHSRARRRGKGIDGLLEKWEFRHRTREDRTVCERIGALIRENHPGETVLLTGTVPQEKMEPVFEQLQASAEWFTVKMIPDFIHQTGAAGASGKADCVLLVEEKETSRMADIDREAELLNISNAKVSGFIML